MLRITMGQFRGQTLEAPGTDLVRSTQAKTRQALFNSLQTVITDAKVLDLFAGSGALGFEALSCGAAHVTFVDHGKESLRAIANNIQKLKVHEQVTVLAMNVERSIPKLETLGPFDLILADPPYSKEWETKLLNDMPWRKILKSGGLFCLEWMKPKTGPFSEGLPEKMQGEDRSLEPFLFKIREKKYGTTWLTTFRGA